MELRINYRNTEIEYINWGNRAFFSEECPHEGDPLRRPPPVSKH